MNEMNKNFDLRENQGRDRRLSKQVIKIKGTHFCGVKNWIFRSSSTGSDWFENTFIFVTNHNSCHFETDFWKCSKPNWEILQVLRNAGAAAGRYSNPSKYTTLKLYEFEVYEWIFCYQKLDLYECHSKCTSFWNIFTWFHATSWLK